MTDIEVLRGFMEKKFNVNCNLEVVDKNKFDELMEKYMEKSIGKFHQADLLRECIRFTWENSDKIGNVHSEIARLNEIIIRQQKEMIDEIEKAKQSLGLSEH
jgi:aminoglycoside phosphotransferase family enzyme